MNVLMVGGAGMVGSILRPALEMEHEVWVYDRKPALQAAHACIVGDVDNDDLARAAVTGMDAIVYMAMGTPPQGPQAVNDISLAFGINTGGWYRFLRHGLEAGVRHFVYASTFDVYGRTFTGRRREYDRKLRAFGPDPAKDLPPLDEDAPLLGWHPYAASKRAAEHLCFAAADQAEDATIVALRLVTPRDEENFPSVHRSAKRRGMVATGPNDLRRLFLAAVALDRPGAHIIQASSDVEGTRFSNRRAAEILGWIPQGD